MVENKVRKGDVVALACVRSTTYGFGSGRGTERETYFTLAVVNGANHAGEATSLRRRTGSIEQLRRKDYELKNVRVISGANQKRAKALFDKLTWETDQFKTADELKNAILTEAS
jgi:hypothetical protein